MGKMHICSTLKKSMVHIYMGNAQIFGFWWSTNIRSLGVNIGSLYFFIRTFVSDIWPSIAGDRQKKANEASTFPEFRIFIYNDLSKLFRRKNMVFKIWVRMRINGILWKEINFSSFSCGYIILLRFPFIIVICSAFVDPKIIENGSNSINMRILHICFAQIELFKYERRAELPV